MSFSFTRARSNVFAATFFFACLSGCSTEAPRPEISDAQIETDQEIVNIDEQAYRNEQSKAAQQ